MRPLSAVELFGVLAKFARALRGVELPGGAKR